MHIIEVGYSGDWHVHERVKDKLDQHEQLHRNLRAFVWTSVHLHAFVLGHSGVMPGGNVDVLHSWGVCRSRVGPFLAELAVASLHKSCGILCTFPLQSGSPPGVVSGVLLAQPAAPSLSVLPVQPAQPRHEVST